jgi:adenosylcobinamide kinase / adenosylcobinamide-phosphate guanylyltransferase
MKFKLKCMHLKLIFSKILVNYAFPMEISANITLVTGGQRSGKSRYAQELAESASSQPTYLATARYWDKEFEERIAYHKKDRGDHWICIEEEKCISKHQFKNKVVLLDCITLWLTNFFTDLNMDKENTLNEAKKEWHAFIKQDMDLIVVSNEIGSGIIPMDANTRAFADIQGWMNQHIARQANKVVHMVCGIPNVIKD